MHGALHEGGLCAAVQLRGSIPLVWGHGEQKQIVPRPDIHLQRCARPSIERRGRCFAPVSDTTAPIAAPGLCRYDPMYDFTLRHFSELHQRCPAKNLRISAKPGVRMPVASPGAGAGTGTAVRFSYSI